MFFYFNRIVIINVLGKNVNGGRPIRLGDVHIPLIDIVPSEWNERKTYELNDLVCIIFERL